jgi:4-diphosphocytidyl-2-C-methyl-D-erythritol kinase
LVERQGDDPSASVWWTPAKINLFLAVSARRADGYHELETLMTAVTIFDTLVFALLAKGEIELSCEWAAGIAAQRRASGAEPAPCPWDPLPPQEQNLVGRALRLLQQRSGTRFGARVRLVKRIPSAAGLGGASSDAATALVAANVGWGLNWSLEQLAELAAEIGSDVPFFLHAWPAICRGRGEQMERVSLPGMLPVVVVRPPMGLSTAEVYRHCQPGRDATTAGYVVAALQRGDRKKGELGLLNRLQAPAEQLSPWVGKLTSALKRQAGAGHMSGSGSSCFVIGKSARHARRLAARLRAEGWQAAHRVATTNRVERT